MYQSEIELNLEEFKFTQDSIGRKFRDGIYILSGAHVDESIRITEVNGYRYFLDNRRAYAKFKLGKTLTKFEYVPIERCRDEFNRKNTSVNNGGFP
jgi:hypothetical protein